MNELEKNKQKRLKEEQEKKKKDNKKSITTHDYNNVITEDGTLASFNFNDNYKSNK